MKHCHQCGKELKDEAYRIMLTKHICEEGIRWYRVANPRKGGVVFWYCRNCAEVAWMSAMVKITFVEG